MRGNFLKYVVYCTCLENIFIFGAYYHYLSPPLQYLFVRLEIDFKDSVLSKR